MSEFTSREEYYTYVLENVGKTSSPRDILVLFVNSELWEFRNKDLYGSPKNYDEANFAFKLRELLETAVRKQMTYFQKLAQVKPPESVPAEIIIDFGLLFYGVTKLAKRDAHLAMILKIEMARIARRAGKCALDKFVKIQGNLPLNEQEKGEKENPCARL